MLMVREAFADPPWVVTHPNPHPCHCRILFLADFQEQSNPMEIICQGPLSGVQHALGHILEDNANLIFGQTGSVHTINILHII